MHRAGSLTPAQLSADRANLVKARAAHPKGHLTGPQLAADRANLVKARAAHRKGNLTPRQLVADKRNGKAWGAAGRKAWSLAGRRAWANAAHKRKSRTALRHKKIHYRRSTRYAYGSHGFMHHRRHRAYGSHGFMHHHHVGRGHEVEMTRHRLHARFGKGHKRPKRLRIAKPTVTKRKRIRPRL
jgi:hypothetical protein